MAQIIKTIFQVKRDTEANWLTYKTYVPKPGEPCLTLDGAFAHQVKFGDGVKTWEELPYSGVGSVTGDGKVVVVDNGVVTLPGAKDAVAGQSFRISGDGSSLEWFTPIGHEEIEALEEEIGSLRDAMSTTESTINDLQTLVEAKADSEDVYTKDEVDDLIQIADADTCGVVKSSTEPNKVRVAEDGTMEVVSISFDRLVQSEAEGGSVIVFDGGDASDM